METAGKARQVRLECRECARSYEYEAPPGTPAYPDECPECGGADLVQGLPLRSGGVTGTYRYILRLGRTARVSDRVPGIRGANATRKVPAGARCVAPGGPCGC